MSKHVKVDIPIHTDTDTECIPVEWKAERCIYKVPENLRNLKAEVYTPQLISIGPTHHENENLAAMEKHKEFYMDEFCKRPEMKLKDFKNLLKSNKWHEDEKRIRSSYTEKYSKLGSNEYMKMIVMDAIFIIEFFLRDYEKKKEKREKEKKREEEEKKKKAEEEEEKEKEKEKKCSLLFTLLPLFPFLRPKKQNEEKEKEKEKEEEEEEEKKEEEEEKKCSLLFTFLSSFPFFRPKKENEEKEKEEEEEKKEVGVKELYPDDYLLKNQWLKNGIQQDLLLLENQLPFFFLKKLYKSAFPSKYRPTFCKLTCQYFKEYNRQHSLRITDKTKILHFTDLLRYFMSHKHPKASEKTSRTILKVNAAKLREAGVDFEVNKKACLTDIKFNKGILNLKGKLTMPQFDVENTTERVIRNLVAYEQLHYSSEAYISYYIFLMDCLIDTAEDVELLVEKGIIVNWLGSNDEVAKLVNNLYINITKYNSSYHDICDELNNYYKSSIPRLIAKLRGVYFSDFWRGTATLAAGTLLVLTFLQTINSFYPLH